MARTQFTKPEQARKANGKRHSGGKLHRKGAAIIVSADRVATNMREAFLNIKVVAGDTWTAKELAAHQAQAKIVGNILTSAGRNAGNNVVGRGWTANLSARTVRALTEQGVFA